MTLALFLPIVCRFDFYYDLNDDVLIKDVLSGVYSGTPDGHTMQLLYPLGLLLSLLYRALSVPVFGVFLALCQFGSIFVIGYRTARRCEKRRHKVLALAAEWAFFAAVFGEHLVFMQYTVTAGMLASAAIFWLLTPERTEELSAGPQAGKKMLPQALSFLKENLPAVFLYWTAFGLRTEMALLLLPLAGVAGLFRWGREKKGLTGENTVKYMMTFGVLVLGMALFWGLDSLAYSRNGWPAFRQFFEDRTELYDYQRDFAENYEANVESYRSLGVSEARQKLLENYNFGADDGIDTELMTALREEAVSRPQAGGFFKKSIAEGLWSLAHQHWCGRADFPFNFVWIVCAACVPALCYPGGRRYLLWQAALGALTAAALWMFLLLRDRPADRVFHPLYLGQTVLFAGLLLLERGKGRPGGREAPVRPAFPAAGVLSVLVLGVCLTQLPQSWRSVGEEQRRREESNAANEAVMAYCSAHPAQLFLEDVYSTVSYSEKIAVDRKKPFNYDLLGGWLVKSPLTAQKLSAFGYSTMEEAVRAGGGVRLLAESGGSMEWLEESLSEKGFSVQIVKTGEIAGGVECYQVLPDTAEGTGEMLYGTD